MHPSFWKPQVAKTTWRGVFRAFTVLGLVFVMTAPCAARGATPVAPAGESDAGWGVENWYVFTSLYTKHFDPDPDHVNQQKMIGLEVQMNNQSVFGVANFDNSFGQRSTYLYGGYKWALASSENWYLKLTGGLLHGYEEPYDDKIPLNGLGVAPAIVPTLGFQYKHLVAEVNLAGLAAVTVTAGIRF